MCIRDSHGSVSGRDGVVSVDQAAIKGSRRSNPATYTGLLDPIRKAFAKLNGVKPALFSANSEGACPHCNGAGVIYTDLGLMAGVATVCEVCEGKRFEASVLDYHLGGRDISEVLATSVTEAEEFFGAGDARTPAAHAILNRLAAGQSRERLKLATRMAEKGAVYVLDEPTTGLHLADVEQLLDVGEVEAGGRLVEDVDGALLCHAGGQLEPLPTLSGGEPVQDGVRGRRARVAGSEELLGLGHRRREHLANVAAAEVVVQHRCLEPLPLALLADGGDAGHHRQVGVDDAGAVTGRAGALGVGAEQRRLHAVGLRERLADRVEQSGVRLSLIHI